MYDSRKDTEQHIKHVKDYCDLLAFEIAQAGFWHDQSKLHSPEKEIFDEFTPKLKTCTYGSDEYKDYLKEMKVALDHHYAHNNHHPEKFENGIQGMTLVDLCEMIADWKSATLRHDDGNILKSIEINQKRFNYSDELKQIFINTVNKYMNEPKEIKSYAP